MTGALVPGGAQSSLAMVSGVRTRRELDAGGMSQDYCGEQGAEWGVNPPCLELWGLVEGEPCAARLEWGFWHCIAPATCPIWLLSVSDKETPVSRAHPEPHHEFP